MKVASGHVSFEKGLHEFLLRAAVPFLALGIYLYDFKIRGWRDYFSSIFLKYIFHASDAPAGIS